MIPPLAEIRNSLAGAWRLIRLDPDGMDLFTLTADGFWRSFFAIALVAPMVVVITALSFDPAVEGASPPGAIAGSLLRLVAAWAAAALALLGVATLLGRRDRYPVFIIAWNWISVPLNAAMLLAFLLGLVAPGGLIVLLWLTLVIASAFYDAYIARIALDVGIGQAIAVAAVDLIVVLMVHGLMAGPASA